MALYNTKTRTIWWDGSGTSGLPTFEIGVLSLYMIFNEGLELGQRQMWSGKAPTTEEIVSARRACVSRFGWALVSMPDSIKFKERDGVTQYWTGNIERVSENYEAKEFVSDVTGVSIAVADDLLDRWGNNLEAVLNEAYRLANGGIN